MRAGGTLGQIGLDRFAQRFQRGWKKNTDTSFIIARAPRLFQFDGDRRSRIARDPARHITVATRQGRADAAEALHPCLPNSATRNRFMQAFTFENPVRQAVGQQSSRSRRPAGG